MLKKKPENGPVSALEKEQVARATGGELVQVAPQVIAAPDAGELLARAVERGLPVEAIEKLMVMRTQLKAERAREEYFIALSAFQADCPVIPKNKKVMNKDNRTVRYAFAPLETVVEIIKPILHRHGLSYDLHSEFQTEGNIQVTITCRVHHVAGHSEESSFVVPIERGFGTSRAQEFATARTYGVRYAVWDALGIVTGDEDTDGAVTADSVTPAPASMTVSTPPAAAAAPAKTATPEPATPSEAPAPPPAEQTSVATSSLTAPPHFIQLMRFMDKEIHMPANQVNAQFLPWAREEYGVNHTRFLAEKQCEEITTRVRTMFNDWKNGAAILQAAGVEKRQLTSEEKQREEALKTPWETWIRKVKDAGLRSAKEKGAANDKPKGRRGPSRVGLVTHQSV